MALLGRCRHLRYFRFGWERTLVNRMPDECKIGIEVNPKVALSTTTEPHSVSTTANVRRLRSRVRTASVSRIEMLTKQNFKAAAKRFLRWRKKQTKRKS
jgi:hypothetical protein